MEQITGFLQLDVEPRTVEVVSRLYIHQQHWSPDHRSSSACLAPHRCPGCEIGLKIQSIGLIAVRRADTDQISLLRFPRVNSLLVRKLASEGGGIIGMLLEVARDPSPANTGPVVANLGRVPPRPVPVDKYISAIGQRAAAHLLEHLFSADARQR